MIKHNFLLFFRNIRRYKGTFIINLIGLSTGLASVLLITFWVVDELSFDKFHKNESQLFQVWNKFENPSGEEILHWTPDLLAPTLADELPEVKYAASYIAQEESGKLALTTSNKVIKVPGTFAGEDFLKMFSFPLLEGKPEQVLADISAIVISKSLALKLFGSIEAAMGQSIQWEFFNTKEEHHVSGVFEDIPANSSLQFEFLLPFKRFKTVSADMDRNVRWDNNWPKTFIQLEEGVDNQAFANKIIDFSRKKSEFVTADLFLKKFSSNYLHGKFENGQVVGGRIDYLRLFIIIAIIILAIACINFMNLSTANASRRSKEIAIKKAIGTKRLTLATQHLFESILTVFLSLAAAFIVILIFLPQFNLITGKALTFNLNWQLIVIILGVVCCTGLIAGSYPALYLSGFNPITLLKGKLPKSIGELWARKGLVITQFSLSIILIVGVLIIYKQIDYIQSKSLGMNKDNIVYFIKEGDASNTEAFLNEVKNIPGINKATSTSQNVIGSDIGSTVGVEWPGKPEDDRTNFFNLGIDYNFIETMEMEILEGRSFSKAFKGDDHSLILNEKALAAMKIENPIGKTIRFWGTDHQIVGIVKDFHFESLTEAIKPMIFRIVAEDKTYMHLARIENGREKEVLSKLEKVYKKFYPNYEFDYTFLDQDFQRLYISEQRVASLSKYFAGLAILISCLGLFGLIRFSAEQRRKEIGIRKSLGQSKASITLLLSKEFAKLVGIAILFGLPIAFLLSRNWLSSFAYRIDLQLWYFLIAGAVAILIAMTTVSTQALRAASKNPIEALREE